MINKDPEIVSEKICRSCMCQNDSMRNLFETKEIMGAQLQIADMLMDCTAIVIKSGDGLPNLLCSICEDKLNVAYEFKKQCQRTDKTLRRLVPRSDDVKEEYENPEDDSINVMDCLENDYSTGSDDGGDDDDDEDESGSKDKKFKCIYCQKILATKRGLIIHQRRHTGENLKTCQICNSKFTKTNHLLRHMKTHNGGVCEDCGEHFLLAENLLEHRKSAHSKSESSIKTDDNKSRLKKISNKINDDETSNEEISEEEAFDEDEAKIKKKKKKKGLFTCKHCFKSMTTYVGLKIHMRKHTGTDLAKCNYCEKSFTKNSHLKRHLLSHGIQETDSKPIPSKTVMECEFCDRKFKYRKSFTHHMQTEHGMSDESDVPLSAYVIKEPEEQQDKEKNDNEEKSTTEQNEPNKEENPNNEILPKEDETNKDETVKYQLRQGEGIGENGENGEQQPSTTDVKEEKVRKTHVCHVCQCAFGRANHLTRHMTLHRSLLTNKCDRCEKAFATPEYLKKHIEEDHINKPYMCTTCNKPFSRGEYLIRHLKVHQSKEIGDKSTSGGVGGAGEDNSKSNLKCSICEKTFARSDILARHIKIHLLQDKRHVCAECGKAFNRLDNLKTHQRIHTGVKDTGKLHLCIYCGKEFNNSSNMIVHMRRHTGERPYKCSQCGKGFPRSHDLKCHERTHSGEKPYRCSICGKAFNKSNKLLRHTRVHTGERPYVCNICGRAFTQSNDLALHMRRHTGARPYACGVCPARFIQSGQLKAHRRTTGHWMETQPDLKGGYRVEPVTPLMEPTPIRFKTYCKSKFEDEDDINDEIINNANNHIDEEVKTNSQSAILPLSLMGAGITTTTTEPIIIDNTKLVQFQNAGLVSLINNSEIKYKPGNQTFSLSTIKCEAAKDNNIITRSDDKNNCGASTTAVTTTTTSVTFHEAAAVTSGAVAAVTYTVAAPETFHFQNFD